MIAAASNIASSVNEIFFFIVASSVFFLIGITAAMIYFVFKYSRKKNKRPTNIHGNIWLEIAWTVIPTILVLAMFYVGYMGFDLMRNPPKGAFEVKVTAQMWKWTFEYPNGHTSDVLILPKDRPIKTLLHSLDVLHSFYIPAFRVKEDTVPGRTTYLWFIPTQLGEFDIECAEYCGLRHSYMLAKARVLPAADFDQWYANIGKEAAVKVEESPTEKIKKEIK